MSSRPTKLPKLSASASANSAYNRHIQKCLQYVHLYGGNLPALPVGKNEREQMEEEFEFIQTPAASDAAKKYYDTLFREYALVDLSRWRESKAGLRWRTKDDVLAGLGQFTCAELNCSRHRDTSHQLETFEMVFGYEEKGETKKVLVKVNVCEKDAKKLRNVQRSNEKTKREKERNEREGSNPKKRKSTPDPKFRAEEKSGRSSKHRQTESRSSSPGNKHKNRKVRDVSSGDEDEVHHNSDYSDKELSKKLRRTPAKSKQTQKKTHEFPSKVNVQSDDDKSSSLSELDVSMSEPEVSKNAAKAKGRAKSDNTTKNVPIMVEDSDGSDMSVLIDETSKQKKKPQPKKPSSKAPVKAKTKSIQEDDHSDSSALSSLIDEPQPKKKVTKINKTRTSPPDDLGGDEDGVEEQGNASDSSELSVLIDDEPIKKRSSKSASVTKTNDNTKRRKSQSKDDPDPNQAKIKKLQDWIVKCGVRKVWGKYLQPYPSPKDKIRHLESMLKDLGMDGRPSLAKAEQIRLARELQDEVAAVMDNDVIITKGRSSRSKVAAAEAEKDPSERKMSMKEQIQANKERLAEMYPFSSGGESD